MKRDLSKEFLKNHFCGLYKFLDDKLCYTNSPIEKYKIIKALIECKIALANLYNDMGYFEKIEELFSSMKEYGKNIEGSTEEIKALENLYQSSKIIDGEIAE